MMPGDRAFHGRGQGRRVQDGFGESLLIFDRQADDLHLFGGRFRDIVGGRDDEVAHAATL